MLTWSFKFIPAIRQTLNVKEIISNGFMSNTIKYRNKKHEKQ